MGRYYGALHAVVESHGGRIVKLLGDGVMAAFGLPRVAEDDAVRAVRAALAMQQAFRALAREQSAAIGAIGLRVAANTGEVVVDTATDDVVGDPVNVAARLQDVAQDGDVVIGEATRRLVGALVTLAPLGPVALKGRAETVAAYRVVSLERPAGASAAFVGREEELTRLGAVYDAARAAPAARLAVVLGSPGLGKTRLLDEFTRRLDGATVLVAHCEAAGGATFAPIAKALRAVLGAGGGHDLRRAIDAAVPGSDADRSRIAAGIGALLAGPRRRRRKRSSSSDACSGSPGSSSGSKATSPRRSGACARRTTACAATASRSTRPAPRRCSVARCWRRAGRRRPKRSATRARRSPATTCWRRSPGGASGPRR
jgi:Adenylate and Guanylate cyclase catalytic domain/AAA ATPase domain